MPISRRTKRLIAEPAVRCYLAEDLRQEIGGKVSAIGLYSDNVVVLQLPAGASDPTEAEPIFIRSLAFLFNISKLSEDSTIEVDLEIDGSRQAFMAPRTFPATEPGNSINLLGVMVPCLIKSFGKRRAIVKIKASEYTFEFEVRRATLPASEMVSSGKVGNPLPSRSDTKRKKKGALSSAHGPSTMQAERTILK